MPIIEVEFRGRSTDAEQAMSRLEQRAQGLDGAMSRMQGPALAAAGAVAGLGFVSIQAASDAEQAAGAVESVFGSYAAGVKAQADQAAQNVGLARAQYLELSSVLGAQLANMGTPMDQLAGQTDNLVGLGADLAATFGGTTADAVGALSSLLRGERDPIERYGVSIKEADVAARKAELGLSGLTGEADRAATAQATMALLTEQTTAAQGSFAREANTAAGASQRAAATATDASAALGDLLLPAVTAGATALQDFASWAQQNAVVVAIVAGVVGALAAVVIGYNAVMVVVPAVQAAATAAQWLWNAALSANPIGLVILAVAALIAIVVLLVRNWDQVSAAAAGVWQAIVAGAAGPAFAAVAQLANLVGGVLGDAWAGASAAVGRFVDGFVSGISRAIGWVRNLLGLVDRAAGGLRNIASAGGLLKFSADDGPGWQAPGHSGPATFAVGDPGGWLRPAASGVTITQAPAQVVNITIQGALDPRAVAAQVRDILNRDARIRGVVNLAGVVIP